MYRRAQAEDSIRASIQPSTWKLFTTSTLLMIELVSCRSRHWCQTVLGWYVEKSLVYHVPDYISAVRFQLKLVA